MSPSEKTADGCANGIVFSTRTSRPGRAARRCDATSPALRWVHGSLAAARLGVRGLVEQWLQRGVPQRVRGTGIVEHLLEGLVHAQRLADLLHRAGIIPGVGSGSDLCAQDEILHRGEVREALVALDVPEDW